MHKLSKPLLKVNFIARPPPGNWEKKKTALGTTHNDIFTNIHQSCFTKCLVTSMKTSVFLVVLFSYVTVCCWPLHSTPSLPFYFSRFCFGRVNDFYMRPARKPFFTVHIGTFFNSGNKLLQNWRTNLACSSKPSCSQARVDNSRGWSQIFFSTFNSANGERVLINS